MKRASLKNAKVPVTSSAGKDVTDRILTDGSPAPRTGIPSDEPPRRAPAASPSPPDSAEPLPYAPYRTVSESPPHVRGPAPQTPDLSDLTSVPAPLKNALDSARAAVIALNEAARSDPGRYDLAIRYRLDALAHHLEQVAEFIAGRRVTS